MSGWIIVAACALGLIVGYVLGCERVSRLRRQLNIARRQRDLAQKDLRRLRAALSTVQLERAS